MWRGACCWLGSRTLTLPGSLSVWQVEVRRHEATVLLNSYRENGWLELRVSSLQVGHVSPRASSMIKTVSEPLTHSHWTTSHILSESALTKSAISST